MATEFDKDPNATLDYTVDWETWLGSDTISTSTWILEDGITNENDTNTTTTATIWISGGVAGRRYAMTNRIVTNGGRTDDRTIYIKVADK